MTLFPCILKLTSCGIWLGCFVKQTNNQQQQQQQKPVIWKIWGSFRGHRAAVHPVAVRGRNSCQSKDVSYRTGVQNRVFLIQIEVVWRNGGLTPLVVSRTDNRQKKTESSQTKTNSANNEPSLRLAANACSNSWVALWSLFVLLLAECFSVYWRSSFLIPVLLWNENPYVL